MRSILAQGGEISIETGQEPLLPVRLNGLVKNLLSSTRQSPQRGTDAVWRNE